MKRILFILFILFTILCITSCDNEISPSNNENSYKLDKNSGMRGTIWVKEFTYKNHSYLEFKDHGIYGQGFVHNPDCKCHNK